MAEARAMIDEVGIEAISQEAVAQKVGITQSALRHHFPTRESMFDAIFDHVFHSAELGMVPDEKAWMLSHARKEHPGCKILAADLNITKLSWTLDIEPKL